MALLEVLKLLSLLVVLQYSEPSHRLLHLNHILLVCGSSGLLACFLPCRSQSTCLRKEPDSFVASSPPSPFLSAKTYIRSVTQPCETELTLPDISQALNNAASIYSPYTPDYKPQPSEQSHNHSASDRPPARITTCWFWYHSGHCNRSHARRNPCPYQHRTAAHLVLVPPPGLVHRRACHLPLCPLRSNGNDHLVLSNSSMQDAPNHNSQRDARPATHPLPRFRSRTVCKRWYYGDTCGYSAMTCPQAHRTGVGYILPCKPRHAAKHIQVPAPQNSPPSNSTPNVTVLSKEEEAEIEQRREQARLRWARFKERNRALKLQSGANALPCAVRTDIQSQHQQQQKKKQRCHAVAPNRRRKPYSRSTRPLLSHNLADAPEPEAEFYFSDEEGEIHSADGDGAGAEWFLGGFPDANPAAEKAYSKEDVQGNEYGAGEGKVKLKKTGQWAFLFGRGGVRDIEGDVGMDVVEGV